MIPNVGDLSLEDMDEIIEKIYSTENPSDPQEDLPLSELINKALEEHQQIESKMSQVKEENDNETQHSVNDEDNGKVLPISEQPVNYFSNRIILYFGDGYEIRIKRPFKKNHYSVFIRQDKNRIRYQYYV